MSRFLPDPQIQQLRAMRAGDIAFASAGTSLVAVAKGALTAILLSQSKSLTATPGTQSLSGTPSESPVVGSAFTTVLDQQASQSSSVAAVIALETLSGTPSESPTVGVGKTTTVT